MPSQLNSSSLLSNNIINSFTPSRLWNQKRNHFTLIARHSETKLWPMFSNEVHNSYHANLPNTNLGIVSTDYRLYKTLFSLSNITLSHVDNFTKYTKSNIYLSGLNLNTWNSLDKFFLFTLCASDTTLGEFQHNYSYTQYTKLYNDLL
jgi:hypothetical protein